MAYSPTPYYRYYIRLRIRLSSVGPEIVRVILVVMQSSWILKRKAWILPVIGGLLGILYAFIDEGILDSSAGQMPALAIMHELMDLVFPVLAGISVGVGLHLLIRQKRLIDRLSLKNYTLQKDLLFHTLVSQMLHEIQNPLHNLAAALEEPSVLSPDERKELVQRNLQKLEDLKNLYSNPGWLSEAVHSRETWLLKPWLTLFIEDKIRPQAHDFGISLTENLDDAKTFIHPQLLEQVLLTLFANAFQALEDTPKSQRILTLTMRRDQTCNTVEICLANSGRVFSDSALKAQAKIPVPSQKGLGLGLVLSNNLIEQIGGSMTLSNDKGFAKAIIHLPGAA